MKFLNYSVRKFFHVTLDRLYQRVMEVVLNLIIVGWKHRGLQGRLRILGNRDFSTHINIFQFLCVHMNQKSF